MHLDHYLHLYLYIYMYIHMYIHTHIHQYKSIPVYVLCTCSCTCKSTIACAFVRTCTTICACPVSNLDYSWAPMGPSSWILDGAALDPSLNYLGSILDPFRIPGSFDLPSISHLWYCSIPRRWRVNHECQNGRTEYSRVSKRAHRKHMGVKAVAPYTQECQKRSHRKLVGVKLVAPYTHECQNGRTVYT